MGWEDYLREIQSDGTFGDEITLRAMLEIFNVEFKVTSTLRPAARQIITPHNSVAMARLHLGYFAENEGIHYVTFNRFKGFSDRLGMNLSGNFSPTCIIE